MSMTSSLMGVASWLDDRMNPIVVKELRQSIQSRFVVSVLILLLIVLMTTLFLYVINTETIGQVTGNHGAYLFQIFQGMLVTTCLLFVPAYVGGRLAVERASTTSDLLFISTLRPSSIVWGKLLAGMVVTVLIFSACAPFMVVTYLLRGIDPPTIVFVIGLDLLIVLAATQVAILVGAVPMSMIFKTLLSLIVGVMALWILGAVIVSMVWQMNTMGIGSRMGEWDFWVPILSFVICWLGGVGLLFFLTVAMISPPPSNKAFPLRLYMTGAWVVSLGVFLFLEYSSSGGSDSLRVWAVFASVVLLMSLIVSVSERDVLGPRLLRSIPRNPLLRVPAFFLFSGAASGLCWSILMLALTLGIAWVSSAWDVYGTSFSGNEFEMLAAIGVVGLYLLAYVLTAVLLRRWIFRHAAAVASTSAIALFLVAMGCIVPMIVVYAINPMNWDMHGDWWLALNPFSVIYELNSGHWTSLQTRNLFIASIWSVVMILLNFRWLSGQIGSFRPLVEDTPGNDPSTAAAAPPAPTSAGASTDG